MLQENTTYLNEWNNFSKNPLFGLHRDTFWCDRGTPPEVEKNQKYFFFDSTRSVGVPRYQVHRLTPNIRRDRDHSKLQLLGAQKVAT